MPAKIRTSVLRAFYAAAFDGQPESPIAFRDASFDEYYELLRIRFPNITRETAARESMRHGKDFSAMVAAGGAGSVPTQAERVSRGIARQAEVDLAAVADPRVEKLIVDRNKLVRGWEALGRLASLDDLSVLLCKTNDAASSSKSRRPLRRLYVYECDRRCLRAVLAATTSEEIDVVSLSAPLDLGLLADQSLLARLYISAPLVTGLGRLGEPPLRILALGEVAIGPALDGLLARVSHTLEELRLRSTAPFSPSQLPTLPDLKHLARLRVPVFPEYRREWIDFAIGRLDLRCDFVASTPLAGAAVDVAEIHRGVDILRVRAKGKTRPTFEIAADLASARHAQDASWRGDNGDLQEAVEAAARKAKRKVIWSSEADTFVATAPDVETCRWIIDRALGG